MLLSKNVTINVNNNNKKRLIEFGYDNLIVGNQIVILIEHLSLGSGCLIKAKCDICDSEKSLMYCEYNKNVRHGYYSCSQKCSNIKRENSILKKYGVKYLLQSQKIKNIIKDKNLKEYGVEHVAQRKDIKKKKENTIFKKYGVKNLSQLESIKKKKENTSLKNWGVKNPSQSELIKKKKENTSLKNWGVKYWVQLRKDNGCFKIYFKKYKEFNLHYQSTYELDFLIFCENNNIINDVTDFKKRINYTMENVNRIYYPDFYVKKYNLIIEIKSTYWYEKYFEKNQLKKEICEKLGYKYLFIIDKNYSGFLNIIKK